ncbi:MAG: hypothetical protein ACREMA_08265 [Longimicrobiales bacterium]
MSKLKLFFLVLCAAALSASAASAQACLGLPSFNNGSVHLNMASEFPDSARGYAAGIGAGRHNNLFANLGGGIITLDGFDGRVELGFLEFGYQIPISRAQLCPIAGGYLSRGPNDDLIGIEITSYSAAGGLALGLPIQLSALTLIPNVAGRFEYLSQKTVEAELGTFTDTYSTALVDIGFALVFYDRVSIQPLIHIPVYAQDELDPKKTTFGIFAAFSLPWKAQQQ